jgi:hypothetical protein
MTPAREGAVRCVVCRGPTKGYLLCTACGRSYDRDAARDVSIAAGIAWAAKRARYFATRKRTRRHP